MEKQKVQKEENNNKNRQEKKKSIKREQVHVSFFKFQSNALKKDHTQEPSIGFIYMIVPHTI